MKENGGQTLNAHQSDDTRVIKLVHKTRVYKTLKPLKKNVTPLKQSFFTIQLKITQLLS